MRAALWLGLVGSVLLGSFGAGACAGLLAQDPQGQGQGQDPVPPAPVSAQAAAVPAIEQAFREHLGAMRAARGFCGASVAAVLPGGAIAAVAVGEDAAGAELTPQTRLMSGSIGKTYCAAVVLQLVGEGKLELDAKVVDVLGEREWYARIPNAQSITIRQLLNHTAGIREHVWNPEFHKTLEREPDTALTPTQCLAFVLDDDPLFPAGERFAYADTNYLLAGLCVEEVTGAPFAVALRQRLLEPLGLEDTAWNDSRVMPKLACGDASGLAFTKGKTTRDGKYFVNPAFEYCGGGVRSTPTDLARWTRALFAGDVVPEALRADQRRGVKAPGHVSGGYGLGCFTGPSRHGPAFGHSGIMPGFLSYTLWFEQHDLTVALQFPTDDVRRLGDLRRHVENLADKALVELGKKGAAKDE